MFDGEGGSKIVCLMFMSLLIEQERVGLFEKLKLFLGGREATVVVGDFNCIIEGGDRKGRTGVVSWIFLGRRWGIILGICA